MTREEAIDRLKGNMNKGWYYFNDGCVVLNGDTPYHICDVTYYIENADKYKALRATCELTDNEDKKEELRERMDALYNDCVKNQFFELEDFTCPNCGYEVPKGEKMFLALKTRVKV